MFTLRPSRFFLRLGWTTASFVCLAYTLSAQPSAQPATPPTPQVQVSGDARLSLDTQGIVTLRLEAPQGRANLTFTYPERGLNWSAFRDAVLDVKNQSDTELDITLTLASAGGDTWRNSTQGRFFVRPRESYALHHMMPRPPLPRDHPHVKTLGNLYAFPWGYQRHWQYPDAQAITRITARLQWVNARVGQTAEFSHPYGAETFSTDPDLLKSYPPPWVDTFGQATDRTWPGKVTRLEELQQDGVQDLHLVSQVTSPGPGFSRFGGFLGAPRLKATGFFRVEKVDGRWWFVDPDGHLFWSVGVNTTGNSPETRITDREEYFPAWARDQPVVRFHAENLKHKYGAENWRAHHVDVTVARMFSWGLNTVGGWSMPEMTTTKRVPYTLIIHTDKLGLGSVRKVPDPFSEAFRNSLHTQLSRRVAEHADDPWLVGVFIHNELDWKGGVTLVEEVMKGPPRAAARQALVSFLQTRHSNLAGLNQAWGTHFANFEAIRPVAPNTRNATYNKDTEDFMSLIADTYFRVCREAMDLHFPHHLYLGCRFHTFNPLVNASSSRYCDVVSANLYRHSIADYTMAMDQDRPLLIGEFHFGMRDNGNWGVGLTWAADARNQADLYHNYMSEALRHPNMVGAHWFMWANQVVTGRGDGENFGVGVVTVVDRPNPTLIEAVRNVSDHLYPFRLNPTESRIGHPQPSR